MTKDEAIRAEATHLVNEAATSVMSTLLMNAVNARISADTPLAHEHFLIGIRHLFAVRTEAIKAWIEQSA